MTSIEIKKKLINKISQSDDKVLLKSLYTLIGDESKKKTLALSEKQLLLLRKAEKEIASGIFLTDAEVKKRSAQWLGK
ncbi:MAG: hypothetical protein JSS79_00710 [Bacteroidetes bacterium]|nr:hypothetical protein [Bacteroidota bacterium]